MRRNAFLIAAPQVAECVNGVYLFLSVTKLYVQYVRHAVYQPFLFDHILNVTLRHWDSSMRQLGAQSLQMICMSDLAVLGPQAVHKAVRERLVIHLASLTVLILGPAF